MGPVAEIVSLAANTTTHEDTGLTAATTYTYRVRASNAWGFSGYATAGAVTTANPGDRMFGISIDGTGDGDDTAYGIVVDGTHVFACGSAKNNDLTPDLDIWLGKFDSPRTPPPSKQCRSRRGRGLPTATPPRGWIRESCPTLPH